MPTTLIIFCGKSSAGKDTTANYVSEDLYENGCDVNDVISWTTRPPRVNEKDGRDYFFVRSDEFLKKKNANGFLECSEFRGWYYGTPSAQIEENAINIMVLNPQGVYDILDNADRLPRGTRICVFYIDVPFRVRFKRSVRREGKFKWEYLRRAITDYKDFHSFVSWMEFNLHYAEHKLKFFFSPSGERYKSTNDVILLLRQIEGLPEETVCDRILSEIKDKI